MTKVVKDQVTQAQLKALYEMQEQFIWARDRYLAARAKMVLRLNAGAEQEPGKFHVEKYTRHIRRVAWKQELIKAKGEAYAANILMNTKPGAYSRLEFSDFPK